MARVKILKDFRGSPNGYTVIDFKKDDEADMDGDLLKVALDEKWVKKIKGNESAGQDAGDGAKKQEAILAMQATIEQLEKDLLTASDTQDTGLLAKLGLSRKGSERESIQAEIDSKKKELEALQV